MYGFVCEHRYDGRCLAVVVDDVLRVERREREPQTPHSSTFSLMTSKMNEKYFMSPGALYSRMVQFRMNSVSLAPPSAGAELSLALLDALLLDGLRFVAVLQGLLRLEVADILIVGVGELEDIKDGEELALARDVVAVDE